jgi:hypothetical protein
VKPRQHFTNWSSNIGRAEASRGNLVQQWLKEMMILAIDQGDFDLASSTELPGYVETGEPTSNYKNLLDHQSADRISHGHSNIKVPTVNPGCRKIFDCKPLLRLF